MEPTLTRKLLGWNVGDSITDDFVKRIEAVTIECCAQVGDKEWEAVCDSYAKENGQFHAEIEKLKHDIERHIQIASDAINERDAAIERCAQVAENCGGDEREISLGQWIAAEIRKLKDE